MNCEAEVLGPYCQACGQPHTTHIAPIRQLLAEAYETVFNLDTRLWRTLALLLRRPGALTEAYLVHRRAGFIPPVRLYLTFSVIYFFLAATLDSTSFLFITLNSPESTVTLDLQEEVEAFVRMLPRMMFVIVPLFALLMKGVFYGSRRLYAEHLIFALHLHACWYILFSLDTVIRPQAEQGLEAGNWGIGSGVAVVLIVGLQMAIPVYFYLAIRRVYRTAPLRTLLKLVLVVFGYLLLLGAAVLGFAAVRNPGGMF